jgi:hypothetical protein
MNGATCAAPWSSSHLIPSRDSAIDAALSNAFPESDIDLLQSQQMVAHAGNPVQPHRLGNLSMTPRLPVR